MKSVVTANPFANGVLFKSKKIDGIEIFKEMANAKNIALESLAPKSDLIKKNTEKVIPYLKDVQNKFKDFLNTFNLFKVVFSQKGYNIKMADSSEYSNYFSLQVSTTIANNLTLSIQSVAMKDKVTSSLDITDPFAEITFLSGKLIINSQEISLTSGMSAQEIVDCINFYATASNAQIINKGINSYEMVLSASEFGTPLVISDDQSGSIMTSLGLSTSIENEDSLSAKFTINGIQYTRSSNLINDLSGELAGCILNLKKETTVNAEISLFHDQLVIYETIKDFVVKYNDIYKIVKHNMDAQLDQASKAMIYNEDAYLVNSYVVKYMDSVLNEIFLKSNEACPIKNFSDIGIRTIGFVSDQKTVTGYSGGRELKVNLEVLSAVMENDIENMKTFFCGKKETSNSLFKIYNFPQNLICTGTDSSLIDYSGLDVDLTFENSTITISVPGAAPVILNMSGENIGVGFDEFDGFMVAYLGAKTTDHAKIRLYSGIVKSYDADDVFDKEMQKILAKNETYSKEIYQKTRDIEDKFRIKNPTKLIKADTDGKKVQQMLDILRGTSRKNEY